MHFVVPGPLNQKTGGYIYGASVVTGLQAMGYNVTVHELEGCFPDADEAAAAASRRCVEQIATGPVGEMDRIIVIDGLAFPGFKDTLDLLPADLCRVALIHHPLADETGLTVKQQARFRSLERELLGRVDGVIVSSPFTHHLLVTQYGVSESRITSVLPGTRRLNPNMRRPGRPRRLLAVGSLTVRKAHHTLIAACSGMKHGRWRLEIIAADRGDRTAKQKVGRAFHCSRWQTNISRRGEVSDTLLHRAYRGADAFVLASEFEGYGMVFAEALRHGLPIVATTGGAIPFTVPQKAGLLTKPGDVCAMTRSLSILTRGRRTWRRLRAGAWAEGRCLPDWAKTHRDFAEALRRVALTKGER